MPRSELPHSVKPFSGSGFTLGSGNPSRSRPTATVTIEHQIQDLDNRCYGDRSRSVGVTRKDAHLIDNLAQELNNSCHGNRSRLATRVTWKDTNLIDNLTQQLDNSCHGNRSRSAGVTRKDANLIDNHSVEDRTLVSPYSASSTATDGRSAHNTGDYIDIQNEDHILQEVILKKGPLNFRLLSSADYLCKQFWPNFLTLIVFKKNLMKKMYRKKPARPSDKGA